MRRFRPGGDFSYCSCGSFDPASVGRREPVTPDAADGLLRGRPGQVEADVDVSSACQSAVQFALAEPASVLVEEHQHDWFETEIDTFWVFVHPEPVGIVGITSWWAIENTVCELAIMVVCVEAAEDVRTVIMRSLFQG